MRLVKCSNRAELYKKVNIRECAIVKKVKEGYLVFRSARDYLEWKNEDYIKPLF